MRYRSSIEVDAIKSYRVVRSWGCNFFGSMRETKKSRAVIMQHRALIEFFWGCASHAYEKVDAILLKNKQYSNFKIKISIQALGF